MTLLCLEVVNSFDFISFLSILLPCNGTVLPLASATKENDATI